MGMFSTPSQPLVTLYSFLYDGVLLGAFLPSSVDLPTVFSRFSQTPRQEMPRWRMNTLVRVRKYYPLFSAVSADRRRIEGPGLVAFDDYITISVNLSSVGVSRLEASFLRMLRCAATKRKREKEKETSRCMLHTVPITDLPCQSECVDHPLQGGRNCCAGMHEQVHLISLVYPTVLPRVRVRGVMALFLAAAILWALIW